MECTNRETDIDPFGAFIYFWRESLFLFMAKIKRLKRTLNQLEGSEIQPKRFRWVKKFANCYILELKVCIVFSYLGLH